MLRNEPLVSNHEYQMRFCMGKEGSMPRSALAVDLGGTNLRCSVIDENGNVRFEITQSTGGDEGPAAVIQRIERILRTAVDDQNLDPEVAIGVVAPGPLDTSTGVVRYAPNLVGWHDVPLRSELESRTGRRVILANDANAAALGEFYFGAARDVENMVFVAIGTGFGGGVIAEGQLIDGRHGMGGELGHTTVSLAGPRCSCGSVGCVESFCSGWAIARDGEALVRSGRGEAIRRAAGGRPVDAQAVAAAAEQGDEAAHHIITSAGHALGAALANFTNIFNPEMIVIGGGISQLGDLLLNPAREALRIYALSDLLEDLVIVHSALGTKTGIFGAAALVLHYQRTKH